MERVILSQAIGNVGKQVVSAHLNEKGQRPRGNFAVYISIWKGGKKRKGFKILMGE